MVTPYSVVIESEPKTSSRGGPRGKKIGCRGVDKSWVVGLTVLLENCV